MFEFEKARELLIISFSKARRANILGTPLREDSEVLEFYNRLEKIWSVSSRSVAGTFISNSLARTILDSLPVSVCGLEDTPRYLSSPLPIYRYIAKHRIEQGS